MFTKIAIIGTGNIGNWLFKTLQNQNNISATSVSSRKIEALPKDYDLYIFALKDDVYEIVLQQIPFKMSHALHTSGSLSMNIFASYAEKFGVFYPYQTITKQEDDKEPEKSYALKIPICIESSNPDFETALFHWAKPIFHAIRKINEKQRFAMHLAAVFANNFTNVLFGIAYSIFKENNLDWSLIFPLLENTVDKVIHNETHSVHSGPAVRNDVAIMKKHCNAIKNEEVKELYQLISKIILK
jgi:predicted short-subunit dehydrogenase-like oxidoreductase (DUF2520 family)